MTEPIRVLIVEDREDDALLVLHALRRSGYVTEHNRVDTVEAMEQALSASAWDLVLADYRLPTFSAPEALSVLKRSGLDLPFIIVSGTITEESAVTALRAGAHDFVTKDRLARLAPAVERELREANARRERRLAEERVRFQASLLDAVGEAVIATDPMGVITYWNQAAERLYGWRAEEVVGRPIGEVTPDSQDEAAVIMERLRRGQSWSGEFEVRRKDGSRFPAFVTDSPLLDADGEVTGIVGISSDLTERRRLEAELRQSQKMEAVGRLAGGVAHDFNNILTAIKANTYFLLKALPEGSPERADAEEIRQAAARAAALTEQLLAFGRKRPPHTAVLDLDHVVEELRSMLVRLIGEDVELVTESAGQPVRISADRSQLQQVIVNLAVNARDAMPMGGRLSIEVERALLSRPRAQVIGTSLEPGPYALLTVRDTGSGMSEAVRQRMFEPFFTTKEPGKGTGLGLATVYGIVTQTGGAINVDTEPGAGTVFQIYLPLAAEEAEPVRPVLRTAPVVAGGRILLVEDDQRLRHAGSRALAAAGYEVHEAKDADEALAIVGGQVEPIDLLLTDVVMPGRSGVELAEAFRSRVPNGRVLFMSGYADDVVSAYGADAPLGPYLPKPFTPDDLVARVSELLTNGETR